MYGSVQAPDDAERTAFRNAEKKYKLYYEIHSKKRKQPKKVDLSQVIDFNSISETYNRSGELPSGVIASSSDSGPPFFCLKGHPGFYFIPAALGIEEQCQWIKESLTSFPQPPNRTNHNALYGPIHNLFDAVKGHKVLVEGLDCKYNSCVSDNDAFGWRFCEGSVASSRDNTCKSILASVLLRKLRWSTLGLQFDWSKRNYDTSLPHNKIPDALCQLARRMAAPAMPLGDEFKPEAAIVNYFGPGDTLGGHLDDMEADWSKPIVSLSLGCKAIFLLGGKSREDPPLAMFLRSGDIMLMAGEARECFHGVPRIFTDDDNAEITDLELQLSRGGDLFFLEYIRTSRININIRQVL